MQNIAPPEANTYDSQSSMLIKVAGTKTTAVIYVGDRWTARHSLGFALYLDAGRDRRRQALAAATAALED